MNHCSYLGIDVSKRKLDLALLNNINSRKRKTKVFDNNAKGFELLLDWLNKNVDKDLSELRIIIESTGVYHRSLAYFLADHGLFVSLINPADSHKFIASGNLHKTDQCDAIALAEFGVALNLRDKLVQWQPKPIEIRQLNALITRLDALKTDLQREQNRYEKAEVGDYPKDILQSIINTQTFLKQEIVRLEKKIDDHIDRHPKLKKDCELLKTIPGVGEAVSLRMMSLYHSHKFHCASQMAAFLGLVPRLKESGNYKGKAMLSKRGNSKIRALLYLPAVVAKAHNPDIKHCYERLLAKGKAKMQAIGAAMRRLVHICFGVLKHQSKYQARNAVICA
ncbi:Transposase IS116/IS110/IS902 family [Moraxella caviae]|uniref:Transposase IS116/IS110/IS902 family n=1 Tax=Moraxella caviae TaxID=34060 RepID=A0A378R656_9GAMM|nr:IS110 family transposase [Moraxella caviae]STZ10418.1 Transposase IS116/IS110/IS902 family [Moraxella caviae]VEW10582.1 Transposase IS116/IS110/IS902 family [Moraxella caviae]VEW14007.1 Transposase IS116/IS110/IS902 family [Moraxella caviae]